MFGVMDVDFSSTVDEVMLGESVFPFEGANGSNFSMFMVPRRDPLYIVIPMTIIYSCIFITGVVGNVVTFIVIIRNKYMHTATNYYLFSLAISDLLLLVSGLPQEMVSIWCRYPYMFGEVFCVLRGLSAETSTNASVLTITAFTVERYVAICHPFLAQTMSKLSRAVKLIVVIWFVALSFAIPQAIQFGVITIDNDPDQAMCTLKRTIIDHSFVLSSFLFFVTPMTLITVLYVLIGLKLRKSNMMKRNGSSFCNNIENRSSQRGRYYPAHHQSSKRVLKMLVAVVVAFFICWAPFHAQRLVYTYGSNQDNKPKGAAMKLIYEIITYVSGILYYVSTTINPILYHIMSLKFREAFKDTLARCACTSAPKDRRGRRTYFILNRYYSRGKLSRRGPHSYDADYSSNFVREDSLPSNGLSYDMTLAKYKYRRKTVSVSEATDDSIRTEMTQISHKTDSPSRGGSQRQIAVVVRIGRPRRRRRRFCGDDDDDDDDEEDEYEGYEYEMDNDVDRVGEKFWGRDKRGPGPPGAPGDRPRLWRIIKWVRPASRPKNQITTEYRVESASLYGRRTTMTTTTTTWNYKPSQTGGRFTRTNSLGPSPEHVPMNHIAESEMREASQNNISNSSLKDCNCEDLHEEMTANLNARGVGPDNDEDDDEGE